MQPFWTGAPRDPGVTSDFAREAVQRIFWLDLKTKVMIVTQFIIIIQIISHTFQICLTCAFPSVTTSTLGSACDYINSRPQSFLLLLLPHNALRECCMKHTNSDGFGEKAHWSESQPMHLSYQRHHPDVALLQKNVTKCKTRLEQVLNIIGEPSFEAAPLQFGYPSLQRIYPNWAFWA